MSVGLRIAMMIAALTCVSCSLVEAYPQLEAEEDTLCADGRDNDFDGDLDCEDASCASSVLCDEAGQACDDGVDNDRDGLTDCADPGCDGVCPERGATACRDARDNDGDGLWDTADPGCFAGGSSIGEQRCGSVRETRWTGREVLAGALAVRDVELFPSAAVVARVGPSALVIGSASSTGAIEGLGLTLGVRGEPGAMRYVQLVEPSTGADGPAQGLSIGTDGGGTIQLRSGSETRRAFATVPPSTIEARITGRMLHVVSPETLYDEMGEPTELAVELPALLRDGTPLSIRVRGELATDDGSPWLDITALTLRRPAFHPCSEANPSLVLLAESEALAASYDGSQDLLCALVVEGRGPAEQGTLATYLSEDQGVTWNRAVTLAPSAPSAAALAWNGHAGRFIALLAGDDLTAWQSVDCISWAPAEPPAVAMSAPRALGYEVSPEGPHRLAAAIGAEVVVWESPDGSPSAFVEAQRLTPDESVGFGDVQQVLPIASHVLLVHGPPGAVELGFAVDQPDATLRDAGLRFLGGTGLLGSVDRAGVQWARLVLRPPGSGSALRFTALYGGVEGVELGVLGDHVATATLVVQ